MFAAQSSTVDRIAARIVRQRILILVAVALFWGVGLMPGQWQHAHAQSVSVSEVIVSEVTVSEATAVDQGFGIQYPVAGGPRHIAIEGPGRIWFTGSEGDGIGLITVLSDPGEPLIRYQLEYYGLAVGSEPYDIAYRDGVVWFTMRGANALGRMNVATREITSTPLPTPDSRPSGLHIAPDGNIWIAGRGRILSYTPTTVAFFTEYAFPEVTLAAAQGEAIRYQNSRNIWFTLPDANMLGNYNTVTGLFDFTSTNSVLDEESRPTGLTIDQFGSIWVTAAGTGRVGRYTPTTTTLWVWYDTPTANSEPAALLIFEEGGLRQLWVTESATGSAGRIQLDGGSLRTSVRLPLGEAPSRPWGIQRAADGTIWIADLGRDVLIELRPPYFLLLYFPFLGR